MDRNNTIQEFLHSYEDEVFAELQSEFGNKDAPEEAFFDRLSDVVNQEADDWATRCGGLCAKKFIEQYGTFKAMKLYDNAGYGPLQLKDEDVFHRSLLWAILYHSDRVHDYEEYQAYCVANPLEGEGEGEGVQRN
jgi:hypothetical protein